MKQSLKSVLVLVCICAVMSAALAVTNSITAPIIASNQAAAASGALLEVYPGGGSFTLVNIADKGLPASIVEVHKASNGGYVFQLKTNGYAPDMVIMLGVDASGVITGAKYLSGSETKGLGDVAANTYSEAIKGSSLDTVDAVSQPTAQKTIQGYLGAVKDALKAIVVLDGGNADFRTEEEIFQDNLEAALPSAEGAFKKYFFVEVVEGVDAIYLATNQTGAVCIIGETFVGVTAGGEVLSECTPEEAETASGAVAIIGATEITTIDPATYADMPATLLPYLVSAHKTATGNYILQVKGAGYGIKGGDKYHPASGEYIVVQVSVTPEGKIIDCITVSQKETDGLGSACADEKFYGQFNGKTEGDYVSRDEAASDKAFAADIDGISGATYTNAGYKDAIMRSFNIVKYFEGGNES